MSLQHVLYFADSRGHVGVLLYPQYYINRHVTLGADMDCVNSPGGVMQYTSTHCNALQHTATLFSMSQFDKFITCALF